MSTTLPLFWHLSSAKKEERIDSTVKLVSILQHFQSQFVPTSESENDEESSPEDVGLEALNAPDVVYSIKRLIRGLASSRESSRLGFSVALTELLARISTITASQVIQLITETSFVVGSMTGQEERDVLFARLFGLTALIQSGLLFQSSDFSAYKNTIELLVEIGERKSWIRESAWWSIHLVILALQNCEADWKQEAITLTFSLLFVAYTAWTPEKVALAVNFQKDHPRDAFPWETTLAGTMKAAEILCSANMVTIARILKESNMESEDDGKASTSSSTGNWKPQIHFAWDIIISRLSAERLGTDSPHLVSFHEFFRVCVDESLFSLSSSPERKYWGFQIFQLALPKAPAKSVPHLFTKNFMRSWINHLREKDRYLHKIARQVATAVQSYVQTQPSLGFTLILQLTGVNGNRAFDKLTKTKTIEGILSGMDKEGVEKYILWLLEGVNEGGPENHSRRTSIIDQLSALIHNGSIPKDDEWVQSILDWFIVNGLFSVRKRQLKSPYLGLLSVPAPTFSDEHRKQCRTKLFACLSDLTSQTIIISSDTSALKQKLSSSASTGEFWICRALSTVQALENDQKHVVPLSQMEEKDRELVEEAKRLIAGLPEGDLSRGAELLLATMTLSKYSVDQITTSISLENGMAATKGLFSTSQIRDTLSQDGSPAPIDVFVDIIIGYLEQSTAYLRAVANQVFTLMSSAARESTIDLLLAQLERRNPAELADSDSDSEMEDEDGESIIDGADIDSATSISDAEDASEESDHDESNMEALREKLEEAFKGNAGGVDDLDSEESEDDMDDDQMMAIDETLAAVFRSRVTGNKGVDAQREATHFKNRVLDLLDIFVRKQPANPLVARLVLPVLDLIIGTGPEERQLSEKATGLLRSRIAKGKDVFLHPDAEEMSTILEEIHSRARHARGADILSTISQCSMHLVRVGFREDSEVDALRIYQRTLADFITRKASPLNTAFFQDIIKRQPHFGWKLREDLLAVLPNSVNMYRSCQTFQLINTLINQIPILKDEVPSVMLFMPKLRKTILDFINGACHEPVTMTTSQMKDLLKIGLTAIRHTKRVVTSDDAMDHIWPLQELRSLQVKLRESETFKQSTTLQPMCEQMITLAGSSNSTKTKQSTKKIADVTTIQHQKKPKRKVDLTIVNGEGEPDKPRKKVKKAVTQ